MPMQVPAGAEGAASGRRPQRRCERADARDLERAAREHRMRSRCAAGAEGAISPDGAGGQRGDDEHSSAEGHPELVMILI